MWRGRKLALCRCDVSARFPVVRDEGEGLRRLVFGFLEAAPCWGNCFYCKGNTPITSELWGACTVTWGRSLEYIKREEGSY